jgi:nucleotide-binding universal stress UspA family protein
MFNAILVSTDFSATAKNAAAYALEFAKQAGISKMVLYHNYRVINVSDPLQGYEQMVVEDSFIEESSEKLNTYREALLPLAGNVQLEVYHSASVLAEGIKQTAALTGADLIIMGITGGGPLKEKLIGSNTLTVSKHLAIPVIIVPPGARFTPVNEVLLVCDYKHIKDTLPANTIRLLAETFRPRLFVLNVEHNNKAYAPDTPYQAFTLEELLQPYEPEYHFEDNEDFAAGVNNFAAARHIDLIVTVPKKHSFFESLFKESPTKKLAFHTTTPLMVVKES